MDVREYNPAYYNAFEGARTLIYVVRDRIKNPSYFVPDGIWLYCGAQGTGKTLSAVRTARLMKRDYPDAVLCTNLDINGVDCVPFTDPEQILDMDNGTSGLIFLLDELQVIFNSLESKNIPIPLIGAMCQMRKKRRVILGTSQVYGRVAKPIREQLKYVIDCHNFARVVQVNTLIDPQVGIERDGHISGVELGRDVFFHRVSDYQSYDTYTTIERGKLHG